MISDLLTAKQYISDGHVYWGWILIIIFIASYINMGISEGWEYSTKMSTSGRNGGHPCNICFIWFNLHILYETREQWKRLRLPKLSKGDLLIRWKLDETYYESALQL